MLATMRAPRNTSAAVPAVAYLLFLAAALDNFTAATSGIKGHRARCTNEGEPVKHQLSSCYQCTCRNGLVDCHQQCGPIKDCAVIMPRENCCVRCKGCWYNSTERLSHTEWTDGGRLVRCDAGVITISRPECYTPCQNPKRSPHSLYNCPVCDECVINGQRVREGQDIRIPEEPCLSCRCSKGGLSCAKRACPVLPCPRSQQNTPSGECCPRCINSTADKILPAYNGLAKPCIIGTEFHVHLSSFQVDPCTDCTCMNGTAECVRHTCPVQTCGTRALPPGPGKCCPECPLVQEAKAACIIAGKTYQDGETWQMDACKSCECHGGEPRCAMERCPIMICPPHQTLRRSPGQCCSKCVDLDGICTVFGDPHYKTFDGKFYSFQGSCKYQLVSDCANDTFSIRISNDARNTSHSSWTRTATLRIGPVKINLGKKMRVKVNGARVALPHVMNGISKIIRTNGSVLVRAEVGVDLLWDGDGFLEATVSSAYKGRLCGLCGNFNSRAVDDMTTRSGKLVNDAWTFGTSWRVGGRRACTRRSRERPATARCRGEKMKKSNRLCRGFGKIEAFSACRGRVNPSNYKSACVRDACGCSGARCHCAAYRAYARECSRLGAEPREWARAAWCEGPPPVWLGRAARHSAPTHNLVQDLEVVRKHNTSRHRPPPPILH